MGIPDLIGNKAMGRKPIRRKQIGRKAIGRKRQLVVDQVVINDNSSQSNLSHAKIRRITNLSQTCKKICLNCAIVGKQILS